jgi:hypothetical protein
MFQCAFRVLLAAAILSTSFGVLINNTRWYGGFPSSSSPAPLELDIARRLVAFAFASYCKADVISTWNCSYYCGAGITDQGFKVTFQTVDPHTDTSGFIGVSERLGWIVVAFKGSDSLPEFLHDAKVLKSKVLYSLVDDSVRNDLSVHSGFLECYRAHAAIVVKVLMGLIEKHPTFKVFVTGHSLGGALSHLMAMDLVYNVGYNNFQIYTFGSPRVGNHQWASAFSAALINQNFRFTHWNDIFVHFPAEIEGYRHTAREIFESKDGSIVTLCDDSGEDPNCSDRFHVEMSAEIHRTYLNMSDMMC